MRAAPAISCAMVEVVRTRAYRAAENIRHSLRNGFTAYNVISPVIGFLATVADGTYRQLDTSTEASGPHVFAVRFGAVRQGTSASTAPRPTLMTIAKRPSYRDGMPTDALFRPSGKAKYFLFWA